MIKHKWNGTVLTITSDSGTSSADLKGEKGDDGARGAQGIAGKDAITDEQLTAEVTSYMQEHLAEGGTVMLDSSLSIGGYAADAKATGDAINEVKTAVESNKEDINNYIIDKADSIVNTAQGKEIVATDSSDKALRGLKVFGKSEQASTTGKNLLNNKNTTETINGVTFTVNKDKSVTVNGTATGSNAEFSIVYDANVNGDYILSGCPNGGSLSSYYINVLDTTTWGSPAKDFGSGATLSLIDGRRYHVRILIVKDKTVSNLTFYPMIRLASITDNTFEPYTGGKPSPNPEFPQPIESVGELGSIDVGVYGKNWFDGKILDISIGTESSTGRFIVFTNTNCEGFYIQAIPNETYTISRKIIDTNRFRVGCTKTLPNQDTEVFRYMVADDKQFISVKVPEGCHYIVVYLSKDEAKAKADNYQVELGDVATEYEPPKAKQSLSITTPNGLPAIKVTDRSLATYTDAEGNMWVADEIDYARGKYVQRIGKKV